MKNLIVCTDGTWNTPKQKDRGKVSPTNVYKIFNGIDDSSPDTEKYYDQGVGTGNWDKWTGGITGAGLEENIIQAYEFLSAYYETGDKIYAFGFSRGAYTARSLMGLVATYGIPKNSSDCRLVFEHYRKLGKCEIIFQEVAEIEFLGMWDTVGALGIPIGFFRKIFGNEKHQFHDTKLSDKVKHAFHAIGIDEKRQPFKPTLWTNTELLKKTTVEQKWFVGVHCNIGGGYADTGLSDITLQWMIDKLQKYSDLTVNIETNPNYLGELRNSLSFYVKSWFSPYIRAVNNAQKHNSVCKRFNNKATKYNPENVICP